MKKKPMLPSYVRIEVKEFSPRVKGTSRNPLATKYKSITLYETTFEEVWSLIMEGINKRVQSTEESH